MYAGVPPGVNPIEAIELDSDLCTPISKVSNSELPDDPVEKFFEQAEIEKPLPVAYSSADRAAEEYKQRELEKACGIDQLPAPNSMGDESQVPENWQTFEAHVQKTARQLNPGESSYLFGGKIRVWKSPDGNASWRRVRP